MQTRTIQRFISAREAREGAGVRIKRSLGQSPGARLDPFLLLDAFSSDNPADYMAGFPEHPHRGFETVTYMLEGHMEHSDHLGNRGQLNDGGAQWMTAGRGIVHSEMPRQTNGRMRGFQLWLNLPASEKMKPPAYRDAQATDLPRHPLQGGGEAIVLAGRCVIDGNEVTGFFNGLDGRAFTTDPVYLDIHLMPGGTVTVQLPASHNAFLYAYEGAPLVAGQSMATDTVAVLNDGEGISLAAGQAQASLLVLAGLPIGEPVAQYGPFVMNTPEEIEQALRDYRDGSLVGQ
jgi:hypothetical protein